MKRSLLIISLIICALTTAKAQYYSVNYDQETVAKMVASFNTEGIIKPQKSLPLVSSPASSLTERH